MILFLLAALVIFFVMYQGVSDEVSVSGYQSNNFKHSKGMSLQVFHEMKMDKLSDESLVEFVMMEDRLLGLEKMSVCTGMPRIVEATATSNVIKERFTAYNFSYHTIHLKQIAEPLKLINTSISC